MSMKVIAAAIAAGSVGLNVYQFMTNRGLKAILASHGISTEDKCAILRKAAASLEDDLSNIKANLNTLIDDITSGKVAAADIGERVMDIYRKASKEAPVKEAVKDAVDTAAEAVKDAVDTVTPTADK